MFNLPIGLSIELRGAKILFLKNHRIYFIEFKPEISICMLLAFSLKSLNGEKYLMNKMSQIAVQMERLKLKTLFYCQPSMIMDAVTTSQSIR